MSRNRRIRTWPARYAVILHITARLAHRHGHARIMLDLRLGGVAVGLEVVLPVQVIVVHPGGRLRVQAHAGRIARRGPPEGSEAPPSAPA